MSNEIMYNKLVRDKILDIIRESGRNCSHHIASDKEYGTMLISKIKEELEEFECTPNEEEAADILEAILSLFHLYNLELENIEALRKTKRTERGGFDARIILEKVVK
jgi:predicted house-cleaning noncanonical NTP pyrophosphatase (MazG superfamily)